MVCISVAEYLWDSVVQSPWSPNLTDHGLWFMLALCMSLVFGSCWDFLWWVLPTSWLSEGHSVPWVYGVHFCGRIPVRFSGTVPLIFQAYWSWAVDYVGSVYVLGFWLLLELSFMGLSHQLVIWGSVCPLPLVFCCAGVGRLCWNSFFCMYKVLRLFSCSFSVVCS